MSYGSVMSISNDSSEFNNAILKITGPKTGSTVTVTQGSTVITAIEDNGVWTAEVGKGSWVVKSDKFFTNVTITENKIYEVVLETISKNFEENDWATIKEVSSSGKASDYWNVGDKKAMNLGNSGWFTGTWYALILDTNYNYDGQTNMIHFCVADSTGNPMVATFGTTETTEYGGAIYWPSSAGSDSWINSRIKKLVSGSGFRNNMPNELKNVLTPCKKNSYNKSGPDKEVEYHYEDTTILDSFEIFADNTAYAYWKSGNSKYFTPNNTFVGRNGAPLWWTRAGAGNISGTWGSYYVAKRNNGSVYYSFNPDGYVTEVRNYGNVPIFFV